MAQLLLLRGAKQLLTLRGPSGFRRGAALDDLGVIEDGSVLIRDQRILSVGPARRIENLKESRNAVDVAVTGCVVMPGFVDPALHVSLYQNRASAEAPLKRKKAAQFHEESALLLRACVQHGTLSAQFKVAAERDWATASMTALRQLSAIKSLPIAMQRSLRLPAEVPDRSAGGISLADRLALFKRRELVHFLELSASKDSRADPAFWELFEKTRLPVNLVWPGGAAELLREYLECGKPRSVFCPPELSAAECTLLANAPSLSIFTPSRELLAERENPSAKKLVEMGAAVALASGYDSKDAHIFSMQMVVALAVLRLRLTIEQAISATTINAAHALGCADQVGSLEAGKRADILVLNVSDYRELPRRIGVNQVTMALRDGNFVINRRRAKASA